MAHGRSVRVLARRPTAATWDGASPEVVIGDLDDREALAALTRDADVVIHGAGLIKAMSLAEFMAVNRDGTARLAETTGGRMLQISSLAARKPSLSHYAASKRAGEAAAREILGDRLMVLRPPAIYGPGDRETLGLFQAAGVSPVMPMPADARARLALAHSDDVAALIIECLGRAWTPGVFAVGGARPDGYGWREIFETAATAVGRKPILLPLPAWALRAAGAGAELVGAVRGTPMIFNRGKVRELLHRDWSVPRSSLPPGAETPFRDLKSGFEHAIEWYREAGWLA